MVSEAVVVARTPVPAATLAGPVALVTLAGPVVTGLVRMPVQAVTLAQRVRLVALVMLLPVIRVHSAPLVPSVTQEVLVVTYQIL